MIVEHRTSEIMALFTAKARPRLTRSSISSIKKKEREMYIFMYFLALALLLVVSVTVVQLSFGRSSAHTTQGNPLNAYFKDLTFLYCLASLSLSGWVLCQAE